MSSIFLCAISNIKSGACEQDCAFCAQSISHGATIDRYSKKPIGTIIYEAKRAKERYATGFCLVSSGKSLTPKTLALVCDAAKAITDLDLGLKLIACNGVVADPEDLYTLKAAGVQAYNHNLETSEAFYPTLCSTHTWQERYRTCKHVGEVGLDLVCGGIFGVGESEEDRVSLLTSIASLNPKNVPLNFFHPNPALPISQPTLSQEEALKIISLARTCIPNAQKIMLAGGRERVFGKGNYTFFSYGANAMVIGDYLTTQGEDAKAELEALKTLGLEIAGACKEI
ncbi:biotin synthase [Sulfurospirillum sp. T05]|uniref:Biotin synthase n=1 Tax=Sulfurospirillum tamanense TaxID=2813362 RepID=A0ABS2WPD2_9BACT|nr:biotin synthase [Sulfurospirillum tamanensis]MBN2963360.1 biotin synthase [Sulfurospirillum tamanensis]